MKKLAELTGAIRASASRETRGGRHSRPGKSRVDLREPRPKRRAILAENARSFVLNSPATDANWKLAFPERCCGCRGDARRGKILRKLVTAGAVLLATNAGTIAEEILGGQKYAERIDNRVATAPLTRKQIAALGMESGRPFYTVDLPYLWPHAQKSRNDFGSGLGRLGNGAAKPQTQKHLERPSSAKTSARGSAQRLRSLETTRAQAASGLKNVRVTHRWGGPILLTERFSSVFRAHARAKTQLSSENFSGHGVAPKRLPWTLAAEVLLEGALAEMEVDFATETQRAQRSTNHEEEAASAGTGRLAL